MLQAESLSLSHHIVINGNSTKSNLLGKVHRRSLQPREKPAEYSGATKRTALPLQRAMLPSDSLSSRQRLCHSQLSLTKSLSCRRS
jgi:hypothetical protein